MLPLNTKVQAKGVVNSKTHTVNSSNIKTQVNSSSHTVNLFHLIIQNHNTINYIQIGISIIVSIVHSICIKIY